MKYLDQIIFNNSIGSYLISVGIVLCIAIFRKLLSKGTAWLLSKLITTKQRMINRQLFNQLVVAPISLFLVVLSVIIAFHRLQLPDFLKFTIYKAPFQSIIESISRGILIGSFVWLCNRIIIYVAYLLQQKAAETPDKTDDQLVVFFRDFLKTLVWIAGGLLILKYSFGFNLSNVLTSLSIVGAALALAFRESLENLIASFVIFFDKPFTIGDLVKVESVTGTVEKLGLRSTRIRTTEKTYVTVPNKKMVDTILDNQSLRTQRNVVTTVSIGLKTNAATIVQLIEAIENLLQQPSIIDSNVYLADTGNNAHLVHVEYFVAIDLPIKSFFKLRQHINLSIMEILEKNSIDLAAANVDVVVHQQ